MRHQWNDALTACRHCGSTGWTAHMECPAVAAEQQAPVGGEAVSERAYTPELLAKLGFHPAEASKPLWHLPFPASDAMLKWLTSQEDMQTASAMLREAHQHGWERGVTQPATTNSTAHRDLDNAAWTAPAQPASSEPADWSSEIDESMDAALDRAAPDTEAGLMERAGEFEGAGKVVPVDIVTTSKLVWLVSDLAAAYRASEQRCRGLEAQMAEAREAFEAIATRGLSRGNTWQWQEPLVHVAEEMLAKLDAGRSARSEAR